jgi:hypothetical protein
MAINKQYITWQRLWNGTNVGVDPSAQINNNWNYGGARKVTCTELSYGHVPEDSRLLAIVEFDDAEHDPQNQGRFFDSLSPWVGTKITPQKALSLCNEWYPSGEDPAYFTLDVDNFTLIDGRPVEEEL